MTIENSDNVVSPRKQSDPAGAPAAPVSGAAAPHKPDAQAAAQPTGYKAIAKQLLDMFDNNATQALEEARPYCIRNDVDLRAVGLICKQIVSIYDELKNDGQIDGADDHSEGNSETGKPQDMADQYVNLREILYLKAQTGDTAAILAWTELTRDERANEEIPEDVAKQAIASLKGMAQEYAATLPADTTPTAAIMGLIALVERVK